MKKRILMIAVPFCLIISLLVVSLTVFSNDRASSSAADIPYYKVESKKLKKTMLVPGVVKENHKEHYYLDSTISNKVTFNVNLDDDVKKGQLLYSYESPELQSEVNSIELQIEKMNLEYNELLNKKDELNVQYEKIERETEEESKEESDEKDQESEEKNLVKNELEDIQHQINLKDNDLKSLNNSKDSTIEKIENLNVYSKDDGKVTELNENPLSALEGNSEPLISIMKDTSFVIEGSATELQRPQIKEGMRYKVTAKAAPDQSWEGEITTISDKPETLNENIEVQEDNTNTNNLSTFSFTGKLDSQDNLMLGFHVSIEITLDEQEGLFIPDSALYNTIDDKNYILALKDNRLEKVNVTTGMANGEFIEVHGDVKIGDVIVEEASTEFSEGMEVE
ncbi:hypothetical protein CHH58_08015 [Terribacillus saccharophilus]|uniref:efflux RND transporter periplasmic adaptor subunit n=1 Tax=Terribacillus saccharophilus TaxID=361277 RepID=UPI000BA5FED7|nr:efflux RND transporter periplasmic adaptor subunit [Terribacillus saccharophilus]PAF36794.1 hypothetical protein CHH58_08015 [Terribacillus saccharophilus]